MRKASFSLITLVALTACSDPPKRQDRPPPSKNPAWKHEEFIQGDVVTFQDSVQVTGSEEEARARFETTARKSAVACAVKDIIKDEKKLKDNDGLIRGDLVERPEPFVVKLDMENHDSTDGGTFSARVKLTLSRAKLEKALEERNLLERSAQRMRVIVVVQKPAPGVEGSGMEKAYLDDLALDLSRALADAGFQATLWKDARLRLAERRDTPDPQLEKFLSTYVEESSWRKPEDERYALPLLLLRTEGRLLIGFQIVELEKKELAMRTLMKADAYDLVNGQSLGYETERGELAIGDLTLVEARQQIVTETARKLTKKILDKTLSFFHKQMADESRAPSYTFRFDGWDEKQLSTIRRHLAGIVAENITTKLGDRSLVVNARINRDPIPVSEEIERSLKLLGLPCRTPKIDGNTLTFAKE